MYVCLSDSVSLFVSVSDSGHRLSPISVAFLADKSILTTFMALIIEAMVESIATMRQLLF